jgi:hypothetical protein
MFLQARKEWITQRNKGRCDEVWLIVGIRKHSTSVLST